jgi:hypothetical protein
MLPVNSIAQEADSVIVSQMDTLKVQMDTLKVQMDTLSIAVDTVSVPTDTLKITIDSLPQDSTKAKIDSLAAELESEIPDASLIINDDTMLQDSLLFPGDTIPSPAEAIPVQIDSTGLPANTGEAAATQEMSEEFKKVIQPKDTIVKPSGFEIAIDYGKLFTLPSDFEIKAEGAIGFSFKEKLQILVEVGYGKLTPQEAIKNGDYTSEGVYARGGIAYGGEIIPKSYVYLGVMYGLSEFEDGGTVLIESEPWEDFDGTFNRTDLSAEWIEFILITETEFRDNLFLGSKWRIRSLRVFEHEYDPIVYSIPGYGRSFDNSIPAINLYVKYRFKF